MILYFGNIYYILEVEEKMSKFCRNCGTELTDEAAFCKNCGTKTLNEVAQDSTTAQAAPAEETIQEAACDCEECKGDCSQQEATEEKESGVAGAINGFIGKVKNKDKNALLIIGGAALALVVMLVLIFVFAGSGPEDAADNYFKVAFKGKVSKVEDLAPEAYWEFVDEVYGVDVEDAEECAEIEFEKTEETLEELVGKDVSFSYDITDTDEVGESDLDEIKDYLKEHYDIAKKDVEEAVELEMEVVAEGDDDEEDGEITIYAVKIDGDWYPCSTRGELLVHSCVTSAAALKELDGLGDLSDALDDLNDLLG